jgi:hypothetical protein
VGQKNSALSALHDVITSKVRAQSRWRLPGARATHGEAASRVLQRRSRPGDGRIVNVTLAGLAGRVKCFFVDDPAAKVLSTAALATAEAPRLDESLRKDHDEVCRVRSCPSSKPVNVRGSRRAPRLRPCTPFSEQRRRLAYVFSCSVLCLTHFFCAPC